MKRIANLYKNAYSGLAPESWWLALVMLINRSGTMVIPFMTLYLTDARHFSIADAGAVMAVFGAGAICGGIIGGRLTDRFGFYNIQVASLICGGMLFIALGQMTSLPAICVCAFILSVCNDSFRPANATAVAHYSKVENRTRSYSLNRLAINLGWTFGGAIGGIVASHDYRLLFWIDGITNVAAALMLRSVLSPARNGGTPRPENKAAAGGGTPYSDRDYLVFIVLTVTFGCTFFQLFSTLPIYYSEYLHLTPFFFGCTVALNGILIVIFEMAVIFHLEKKQKNLQYMTAGALLTGLSFAAFNLLPGTWQLALLAMVVLTAGEMLTMPFMNTYWISRTNDQNRGQYAGLFTVGWSVAQILAPYTGTQIAQHFGFARLWWVAGGFSIVTAAGFQWLRYRAQRQKLKGWR